jgi:hypothetical protein
MPNPNITVSSTAVRVVLSEVPAPLTNPPVGTFNMPALTIDEYGRVTAASQTNDIATASTQDALETSIDSLVSLLSGGISSGTWTQT